jgi:hypothetical protein
MGGLGLGNLEASVVRGDSGGPGLIGNKIAGVHASLQNGWGQFGSILYMSRVSDFVHNRDSLFDINDILQTPDDIVLDMDVQDDGNDLVDDQIHVELVGVNNNRVRITINGQERAWQTGTGKGHWFS